MELDRDPAIAGARDDTEAAQVYEDCAV